MLLKFSVGNFLSFKDIVTLDMTATSLKDMDDNNYFSYNNFKILNSSVLYGSNASGKSNLIKAMMFLRWFITNSSKETQIGEIINIEPFKLCIGNDSKPSYFEIIFFIDNIRYRYGFKADKTSIKEEWLFRAVKHAESMLFVREKDSIEISRNFKEGRNLEKKTRDNALFLSVVANFNGEISTKILKWFEEFHIILGSEDARYKLFTIDMMNNIENRKRILDFLKQADKSIAGIDIVKGKINFDKLSKEDQDKINNNKNIIIPEIVDIITIHNKYDDTGNIVGKQPLLITTEESSGTNKYFNIIGPIIHILLNGSVLVIDELDAKLHPLLTRTIVKLFNSKEINKKNAQLIFATHDTNLLNGDIFRRDQIWFCEKNQMESTDLYSLADHKIDNTKVRNDASYEKDYIKGRYGAIPFIGDFKKALGIE